MTIEKNHRSFTLGSNRCRKLFPGTYLKRLEKLDIYFTADKRVDISSIVRMSPGNPRSGRDCASCVT
jgi:hypothetical protein